MPFNHTHDYVTEHPHHTASIEITAATSSLAEMRSFVEHFLLQAGVNGPTIRDVVLSADEACANLINHAFLGDDTQTIQITVCVSKMEISIEISDSARPFDPATVLSPNMDAYFAERRVGGLGITLMRQLMDTVTYTPATDSTSYNTLVLTKRHSSAL